MRLGGRRTVVSDINVTPMADIMIVLLQACGIAGVEEIELATRPRVGER